jgi:hypothetical protein
VKVNSYSRLSSVFVVGVRSRFDQVSSFSLRLLETSNYKRPREIIVSFKVEHLGC